MVTFPRVKRPVELVLGFFNLFATVMMLVANLLTN
jgi:hypothetical protein